MKVREIWKKCWKYGLVFVIPWLVVFVHALIRHSWFVGEGSILVGDAADLYVPLYTKLYDALLSDGTFGLDFDASYGIQMGEQFLKYLVSPFSLLIFLVERDMIPQMVQIMMVLKWSCLSVSMLYYVSHTQYNKLTIRKDMVSIMLSMAYLLGNVVVTNLNDLSAIDVMIVVPLLMLMVEKVTQGKGAIRLAILMALIFVMNVNLAIPVAIFSVLWCGIQLTKGVSNVTKCIFSWLIASGVGIAIGLLPMMLFGYKVELLPLKKTAVMSFYELLQRFFICDTPLRAQTEQPLLYCSVVVLLVSLLFVFTKVSVKEKIVTVLSVLFVTCGLLIEPVNDLWNGMLGISGSFSFLLTFMMVYLAMMVLANLEELSMWQIVLVGLLGVAGCVLGFLNAKIFLSFYVYLATFLVLVFTWMMLIFYKKNSIQYRNVLIVLSIVAIGELSVNAVYQLKEYDQYRYDDIAYNRSIQNVTKDLALKDGEKVAFTQAMYNYGLYLDIPNASWEHRIGNEKMSRLYKELGMEWNEQGTAYHGGSPLLNTMFNIRYATGQSVVQFADCKEMKSATDEYSLYEMNRLVGAGYMVDEDVVNWSIDSLSPFELQNDFVKKATGLDPVFEMVIPEANCQSLKGVDPNAPHDHEHAHDHEHEHEGEVEEVHDFYYGEYLVDTYYYHFRKYYVDDVVNYSFRSDGKTDYYIHVKCADPSITYLQIKGEYISWDQYACNQKTIHVGVQPEGTMISVISDVQIDDHQYSEIWYQVAGFSDEKYDKVYEELKKDVLSIEEWKGDRIKGKIKVTKAGVMMTSIAVQDGMKVYVDGQETDYVTIGGALLGVSLPLGEHEIVIEGAKNKYLSER